MDWGSVFGVILGLFGYRKPATVDSSPPYMRSQRMALTVHNWPRLPREKAIKALRYLNPSRLRLSSMQMEVLRRDSKAQHQILVDEGFRLLPICGSNFYGMVSKGNWRTYCKKFTEYLPDLPKGEELVCQFLNEANTGRFTSGPDGPVGPSVTLAFERHCMAVEEVRKRFPSSIVLAGGLTCENKTGSVKIAAPAFLEKWISYDTQGKWVDVFCFHYYDTDRRNIGTLTECINIAKIKAGKPVAITETGSATDPAGWYTKVKNGIAGVNQGYCGWYCFNDHPEFMIVDAGMKQLVKGVMTA